MKTITRWRLLGYIKLIDASRPETMDKYTVEVLAHQENMLLLQMFTMGISDRRRGVLRTHCVDFLKRYV